MDSQAIDATTDQWLLVMEALPWNAVTQDVPRHREAFRRFPMFDDTELDTDLFWLYVRAARKQSMIYTSRAYYLFVSSAPYYVEQGRRRNWCHKSRLSTEPCERCDPPFCGESEAKEAYLSLVYSVHRETSTIPEDAKRALIRSNFAEFAAHTPWQERVTRTQILLRTPLNLNPTLVEVYEPRPPVYPIPNILWH